MHSKELQELYKAICDVSCKNTSKFKNFVVDIINMFKPGKVIINYYTQVFATVDMTNAAIS